MKNREYYDLGESPKGRPFQPSKDACQRLWHALSACDGQIHCIHDWDVKVGVGVREGMTIGQTVPNVRVSIQSGLKELFEEISGFKLEVPVIITGADV